MSGMVAGATIAPQGCFEEWTAAREFTLENQVTITDLTPDKCQQACADRRFTYAALQVTCIFAFNCAPDICATIPGAGGNGMPRDESGMGYQPGECDGDGNYYYILKGEIFCINSINILPHNFEFIIFIQNKSAMKVNTSPMT